MIYKLDSNQPMIGSAKIYDDEIARDVIAVSKLILSITSDRALGGINNSLKTYSKAMALADIGHVIIITKSAPALDELGQMDNVKLILLPALIMRFHILTRFLLHRKIRRLMAHADAIFLHNGKHAGQINQHADKTYVINHNGKARRLDRASNIIFLNHAAKQNFHETFNGLSTPCHVIGHGFDVGDEIVRPQQPPETVKIISAGRLMEKKGYRDLVETARILADKNTPCHITIFGEGPDEAYLKQKIADYQLHNIGIQPWTKTLRAEYAKADIFCAPSHGESFPLVIGEALETGLAIAATRTNGGLEYFNHYASEAHPIGRLSDIGSAEQMADVLDELVRNHELRRQMSTNARTLLTTRLSLRVLGEKFTALCDKKLG